jgi:hypothetical protein
MAKLILYKATRNNRHYIKAPFKRAKRVSTKKAVNVLRSRDFVLPKKSKALARGLIRLVTELEMRKESKAGFYTKRKMAKLLTEIIRNGGFYNHLKELKKDLR